MWLNFDIKNYILSNMFASDLLIVIDNFLYLVDGTNYYSHVVSTILCFLDILQKFFL